MPADNSTNLFRVDVNSPTFEPSSILQNLPMKMEKIICSSFGLLMLSTEGAVYTLNYSDTEPVSFKNELNLIIFLEGSVFL